ncbi:hypothetical protein PAPHI01_1710 [Pancytospora philotis]|nr:hypothetical protein PAPHI01_1710 [Pancytospora philotis]
MRCVTKLTCIAQCIAIPMWGRLGGFDDDSLASNPALDSTTAPHSSGTFSQAPPSGSVATADSRSEAARTSLPEMVLKFSEDDITAPDYHRRWIARCSEQLRAMLTAYVKKAYGYSSFDKREEFKMDPLLDEYAAEWKLFVAENSLLRESYGHVLLRLQLYRTRIYDFIYLLRTLSLRPAAGSSGTAELDAMKEHFSAEYERLRLAGSSFIYDDLVPPVTKPAAESFSSDDIKGLKGYCVDMIGRVDSLLRGLASCMANADPGMDLRAQSVFPAFKREDWNTTLGETGGQIKNELEHLCLHASSVLERFDCRVFMPHMAVLVDFNLLQHSNANPGQRITTEAVDAIVADIARRVAECVPHAAE